VCTHFPNPVYWSVERFINLYPGKILVAVVVKYRPPGGYPLSLLWWKLIMQPLGRDKPTCSAPPQHILIEKYIRALQKNVETTNDTF
jgi:hypothetical protein